MNEVFLSKVEYIIRLKKKCLFVFCSRLFYDTNKNIVHLSRKYYMGWKKKVLEKQSPDIQLSFLREVHPLTIHF